MAPAIRTPLHVTRGLIIAVAGMVILFAASEGFRLAAFGEALVVGVVYVASVAVHELAHARAARRVAMDVEAITLSAFGGITRYHGPDPGPTALRKIALAGPRRSAIVGLLGLVVAEAAFLAGWRGGLGPLAMWVAQVNFGLALINLLPFGSLDGAMARAARQGRLSPGGPNPPTSRGLV